MFNLLRRSLAKLELAGSGLPLLLDVGNLKLDERLEVNLNEGLNSMSVQKVKLSLLPEGTTGYAEGDILPGEVGWVRWGGTLWRSQSEGKTKILKDQRVLITARRSSLLLVLPA